MPAYRVDLLVSFGGAPITPEQIAAFAAGADLPAEVWVGAGGRSAMIRLHVGAANAVSAATVAGAVCLTAAGKTRLAVDVIAEVTVRRDTESTKQVLRAVLRRTGDAAADQR